MDKYYQQKRIQDNQKFILKLLSLHIGNYYPLRKWLGIDYKGKINEITNLSIAYNAKKVKKGYQVTREYQHPDLGYKLNLVLDKIPQLALLPAILQPAYGLGSLAFFFLTQTTYQPSTKDTILDKGNPNNNYATSIYVAVYNVNAATIYRNLLHFDISDIPANAIFSQGDLILVCLLVDNTTSRSVQLNRLSLTDWVEAQATWNIYKTGSSWTTAGGDYTTTNAATTAVANVGTYTWNAATLIQDCYDNQSKNVHLLLKYETEPVESWSGKYFKSKEHADTTDRPKLTVTYTVPSVTGAAFLLNFC